MEIRLLETAKNDLREGWKFYEKNAVGLGDYFLDCIQADVRSLKVFVGIHEMSEGFHRMLAKRFPFAVYYLIEKETVVAFATSMPSRPRIPFAANLACFLYQLLLEEGVDKKLTDGVEGVSRVAATRRIVTGSS